ncbi:hypothetical protein EK904_001287 [Melospiza melodia maxima]|nr:hypothetical protein EK904_001287 [Melospiza melodia maxima]
MTARLSLRQHTAQRFICYGGGHRICFGEIQHNRDTGCSLHSLTQAPSKAETGQGTDTPVHVHIGAISLQLVTDC